jgi:ATPase subunit of ABC transporter with duplicated ATPase domains
LCIMMLTEANVLILDEPTNHLDALSKESLKQALKKYPGTVIVVSHEREFITDVATRIFNIEDLINHRKVFKGV